MHEDGQKLAFIVGHYKSGSTWLLNLLSWHPWLRSVGETHIFHHVATAPDLRICTSTLFNGVPWSHGGLSNLVSHRLLGWSRPLLTTWRPHLARKLHERPATLLDLSLVDQYLLRRTLLQSPSKEEYYRRFFRFLYERLQPREYLLEKTPSHIFYVPSIRSIFPKAKLLLIFRDGRDVAVSDRFFREDYQKRTWTFAESIHAWRRAIEAQISYAEQHDIFCCSYESLLSDGVTVTQRLLAFLELPTDVALVKELLHRASFRATTGREPGQEDRSSFNRKGIQGDWQNYFTDDDKKIFKELTGDMLIRLGYEKDNDW